MFSRYTMNSLALVNISYISFGVLSIGAVMKLECTRIFLVLPMYIKFRIDWTKSSFFSYP